MVTQLKRKQLEDGIIDNSKVAAGAAIATSKLADGASFELTSNKGAANGYASLDGAGKVPSSQLTVSAMEYLGNWNASTNSPSLADGVGNAGDVYRVSVAGTQDLGSGSVTYAIGDLLIYSGSIWEIADNSESVTSVNSQTGVVVLDADDISDASTTNKFVTAASNTKLGFITVTQAVDLDTMESNIATNNAKVSADGSVTTHSDVTDAGSGAIITVGERALVASALQNGDNVSELVNDAGYLTSATVDKTPIKAWEEIGSTISAGVSHTLPNSATYFGDFPTTAGDADFGTFLYIYLNGVKLVAGAAGFVRDYKESGTAATGQTAVTFEFDLEAGDTLEYIIYKA